MTNLFTKEELMQFNEMLLGRGMPVQQDGIGYNKADYGACATYFYGVSDAQYADLAKRLVKYSKTQLGVDKEVMKETAKTLAEIADPSERSNGVSLNITENGTLISFRYNETFIETIKEQPKRQWDAENKNWIIPNANVIQALESLEEVGADVKNAISYAMDNELIINAIHQQPQQQQLAEVLTKIDGDWVLLKFKYNKEILDEIKEIDRKDRQWNADFKFWAITKEHLDNLQQKLSSVAIFKTI